MPDTPDYSKYLMGSPRYSLQDMGELAARLGSPMKYDRRGEVLYVDQFSHGLGGWSIAPGGNGAKAILTPSEVLENSYSLKMVAGTSAPNDCTISKKIGLFDVSRVGIEYALKLPLAFSDLRFSVSGYINKKSFSCSLFYHYATSAIYDYSSYIPQYKVIDIPSIYQYTYMFIPVKIVYDVDLAKRIRVVFAGTEYDMTSRTSTQTSQNVLSYVDINIRLIGDGLVNSQAIIPYIILTGNEP